MASKDQSKKTRAQEFQGRFTVVGAGAIGSFLLQLLARLMHLVKQITIVDNERYEAANVAGQDITPSAVGEFKALYQARRIQEINPGLSVVPIIDRVENVPMGELVADAILGAVDSGLTRLYLGQLAWKLGRVYIDAGIEPSDLLARVEVFIPGPDAPCIGCAFDPNQVDLLEVRYPCQWIRGEEETRAPTNAPAPLSAFAGALQSLEVEKLFGQQQDRRTAGKQILIDASNHQTLVTRNQQNSKCLFDHEIWPAVAERGWRGGSITLQDLLDFAGEDLQGNSPHTIEVLNQTFMNRIDCRCGYSTRKLGLLRRLESAERTCPHCGEEMVAGAIHRYNRLSTKILADHELGKPLRELGFRHREIVTIGNARGRVHYELRD